MARLNEYYKSDVAPALMKKFGYKSVMQIPKLDKIVVNVGAGDCKDNSKAMDASLADLAAITGQKAITFPTIFIILLPLSMESFHYAGTCFCA